ncbi:MAG: hypothetical protein U0230_27390 [Polyangiales bacterium]
MRGRAAARRGARARSDARRRRRRGGRGLLARLCAFAVLALAVTASADDTHYATPLLGDRPTGMGSAATGLANESSAAYYNPAGLTRMQRSSISGGLFLKARDYLEVDRVLVSPYDTGDFSNKTQPGFPGFASGSFPFGHRREDGTRPFVLALSGFTLYRQAQSTSAYLGTVGQQTDAYTYNNSDRVSLTGVSFAHLPRTKWSYGISLFLADRRLNHNETLNTVVWGADTTSPYDDSRLVSRAFNLSAHGYSFVFRLGLLHRPTQRTSWGITLQLPGIQLKARAKVREQLYDDNAMVMPPVGTYAYQSLKNLHAFLPYPLEIRGGFAHQISDRALIAADLTFVSGIPDRPLVEGNPSYLVPLDQVSLFSPIDRGRRPVANVSIGTELAPHPNVIARLGFLTDFSAAPSLPATSDTFLTAHVNRYGFSTSLGLRTWGRDSWGRGVSVGFVAMFGRGQFMAAVLNPDDVTYQRTDLRDRTFYLTITGGLATAEQLAVRAAAHVAPSMVGHPAPAPPAAAAPAPAPVVPPSAPTAPPAPSAPAAPPAPTAPPAPSAPTPPTP